MSKIYKRGDTYHCEYRDSTGRRRRESTSCTDRAAAKLFADRRERAAADPRHAAAEAVTIKDALERLLTDRRIRGCAPGTITMYASKAGHLLRILGADTPLARVDADATDAFVDQRLAEGAARVTIAKELTTLRAALKVAKRRGEYPGDIAQVMPNGFAAEYIPRRRILRSPLELQALVDQLAPARAAHVLFIVATAARDSEAAKAEARDIDRARHVVRIRGTKTELSDDTIPIVAWMDGLLGAVLRLRGATKGPMFERWINIRRDLAAACAAGAIALYAQAHGVTVELVRQELRAKRLDADQVHAFLPPVTPNDLRRTHATWLRVAGVEPSLIARQLRHTDERMVMRVYGRMPAEAAGAALAARLGEPIQLRALPAPCVTGVSDGGAVAGLSGRGGLKNPRNLVPRDGIEPPTRGFSILLGDIQKRLKRSVSVKLRRVV